MFFNKLKESEKRKIKSEEFIHKLGILVDPNLPFLPIEKDTKIRTPIEILYRSLSLLPVCINAIDESEEAKKDALTIGFLFNLGDHITEKERNFLTNDSINYEDKVLLSWRVEAIQTLLWSLGLISELKPLNDFYSISEALELIFSIGKEVGDYLKHIKMRTKKELLDELDLYYRLHIVCSELRTNNIENNILSSDIVYERHYALSWITYQNNEDWDNITLLN